MNLPLLPELGPAVGAGAWALAVILATFVSEDLTCIGVGALVAAGKADLALGLGACFAGIVVGDLGLWLAGRVAGRRALAWPWLAQRLPAQRLADLGRWLDRRGGLAVLAARFLPGTRLPLYVAAGAVGGRPWRFVLWVLVAAAAWVPALVLAAAWSGGALAGRLPPLLGAGWPALLAAGALVYTLTRLASALATPSSRARLAVRLAKVWRRLSHASQGSRGA
jgi:membrane protein DedA with SNARE-associated domain